MSALLGWRFELQLNIVAGPCVAGIFILVPWGPFFIHFISVPVSEGEGQEMRGR
jgi:hypothetical protein